MACFQAANAAAEAMEVMSSQEATGHPQQETLPVPERIVDVPVTAKPEGEAGPLVLLEGDAAQTAAPKGDAETMAAPEGDAAQMAVPDGKSPQEVAPEDGTAKCRRCCQDVAIADAMCTPKFRPELRYTCRPCHAVCSQLQRRGVDIKEVLSERAAVTFFVDAKNERANGMEGRLCYAQARALLLQKMIESTTHREREGSQGEFQPLGFWMLKGYDCERIEALAERKDHPILGPTFRIDIEKMSREQIRDITEERLLKIESQARERKHRSKNASGDSSGSAAAQPPVPDLGVEVEMVAEGNGNKKRKSPEEKQAAAEAAKLQRQEDKKRQKLERSATSAAAKALPQLKKCAEKLNEWLNKVCAVGAGLPEATAEHVVKIKDTLEATMKNATHMLAAASKGQNLQLEDKELLTEKSLNSILKDSNEAIRSLQFYIREEKAKTAKQNPKSKAAAKTKATK
eukprot:s344_g24.t1